MGSGKIRKKPYELEIMAILGERGSNWIVMLCIIFLSGHNLFFHWYGRVEWCISVGSKYFIAYPKIDGIRFTYE